MRIRMIQITLLLINAVAFTFESLGLYTPNCIKLFIKMLPNLDVVEASPPNALLILLLQLIKHSTKNAEDNLKKKFLVDHNHNVKTGASKVRELLATLRANAIVINTNFAEILQALHDDNLHEDYRLKIKTHEIEDNKTGKFNFSMCFPALKVSITVSSSKKNGLLQIPPKQMQSMHLSFLSRQFLF